MGTAEHDLLRGGFPIRKSNSHTPMERDQVYLRRF